MKSLSPFTLLRNVLHNDGAFCPDKFKLVNKRRLSTEANSHKLRLLRSTAKKIFFFAVLLLMGSPVFAQNFKDITRRIDSLAKLSLPKSALAETDKLYQLARENNDPQQQIKAVMYRMRFQVMVNEDGYVSIAQSLQQDITQARYPVKPVLQSLLAQTYQYYYQQNRWQFMQRSHVEKPDTDFTKWDLKSINNEIESLFILSLKDYKKEQETPVKDFAAILNGDSTTRYLRPALYDLLVQNALAYFLQEEPALTKPKLPFALNDPRLFGDSRTFAHLEIKTTDTSSTFYLGIKYLQQATLFHLKQPNEEALADIDLQRLEFLNNHATVNDKDILYKNAVQKIAAAFAAKPISADAQVLLGKYYQAADSLIQAVACFNKAISSFPQSFGAKNAEGYLKLIRGQEISTQVEDVNIPGKPLLGLLNYHNVKTLSLQVYKVPEAQYLKMVNIHSPVGYRSNRFGNQSSVFHPFDSVFLYLHKLHPVQEQALQLPASQDYKNHSAEFKIDPLAPGAYVLVTGSNLKDSTLMTFATFRVSHLSTVNRHIADNAEEIKVLDRETGKPLSGVKVSLEDIADRVTDANGSCIFNIYAPAQSYSFTVTTKTDTLYLTKYIYGQVNVSNGASDKTILFTDRQLYRPGQTVYYKGLQLQEVAGKSTIIKGAALSVNVTDNNNKSISSTSVQTNDFGTFAGSFIIPQNILNGYITISTPNGAKSIRVEEYKRPSFQAEFLAVKESYRPNDSVTLKGTVAAYSGYGISKARVAYHVTRFVEVKDYHNYARYKTIMTQPMAEVIADTTYADSRGNFKIKFKAVTASSANINDLIYTYTITAVVTDASNETQSLNTSLTVSNNNIAIHAAIPDNVFYRDTINIRVTNLNNIAQKGTLKLSIYAVDQPATLYKDRFWNQPDQFLLSRDDYKRYFPDYAYRNEDDRNTWAVKATVSEATMAIDDKQPTIFKWKALKDKPSGIYKIVMRAQNGHGDTTSLTNFVYLVNEPGMPQRLADWVIPIKTDIGSDSTAEFWAGTGKPVHILLEKRDETKIISSKWITVNGKVQQLIKVPLGADEKNVSISFLMVYQNRMYTSVQNIRQQITGDQLAIKFLTFRDKLQPGEQEHWKVQIAGKNNERQAAEMVADLYDASLDAIAGADQWNTGPYTWGRNFLQRFNWEGGFVFAAMSIPIKYRSYYFLDGSSRYYEHFGLKADDDRGQRNTKGGQNAEVMIKEPAGSSNLNEILVGYGTQYKRSVTSSVTSITIRGNSTIKEDTEEYKAADYALKNNLPANILDQLQGKAGGVQVINGYGDQAGKPGVINPRTNFNETAFFYPQLHTDSTGQILIDFTIPESLTRWRFRAFAHTKDLKTGYIEKEVLTQKRLSIMANMPRFLREGDTLTISARLANLTASPLKGKVKLQLLNAITMRPVSLLLNPNEAEQDFEVAAVATKAVSFKLIVPAGLDALTYRITAASGNYGDGEENTLPVLPDRMLVTESMPMMVRAGQTKSFTFDKLVSQQSNTLTNKSLTLEYTQNPAWNAVQALPYLMEFPYECSEQLFNRYYANSLATQLVNKMPVIKQVFDQWKAVNSAELLSTLEKNQELKATLIEETPWLRDAENETEQKKRVALLFDLNKMSYERSLNLAQLKEKQLPDGGFSWFGGDRSDAYITRYILAGMGQLYRSGAVDLQDQTLKDIADKAMNYLDKDLQDNAAREKANKLYEDRALSSAEIHAWYTESYFTGRTRSAGIQGLLDNYLKLAEKQWNTQDVYEQGLIALTMLRNKKPDVAQAIIHSLMETAQQRDDMGMYWAKNQAGYYWYQSPIETQSLMIELFTEAGNQPKAVEEMKIWLLRNKQTNNWKTTKATAQACYALLLKCDSLLTGSATPDIKLDGRPLTEIKPDIKADEGSGYLKTSWLDGQIHPALGKVVIANNGKSISWGALYWQYTEKLDKISPSKTDLQQERKYFIEKQTDAGSVLTAVDARHLPKAGDLLKVVVYLKAGRDFEYVQLKDMRPAGTEPVEVLSSYKYQDGLYYYQVTKDVATHFFISELHKGSYVFEYRLRVAQPGNYSTGISTIQSMYAPEFNAHSEGARMIIADK